MSVHRDGPYAWMVGRVQLWEGCGIFDSEYGSELVIEYIGLLDAITVVNSTGLWRSNPSGITKLESFLGFPVWSSFTKSRHRQSNPSCIMSAFPLIFFLQLFVPVPVWFFFLRSWLCCRLSSFFVIASSGLGESMAGWSRLKRIWMECDQS